MSKQFYKPALLLGLFLFALLFAPGILAADAVQVALPVQITAGGDLPRPPETYTLHLQAGGEDTPMPAGQTGGSYALTMSGPGQGAFPPILYDKTGVYTYTITQQPGTDPDCQYDTGIYQVKVYITNAQTGDYALSVTLQEQSGQAKLDCAAFHNQYSQKQEPEQPPVQPTDPGESLPTGVEDRWILYLCGSLCLLLLSWWILRILLKREDKS